RIEIVTGVAPGRGSCVLLYGANIGQHGSPMNFNDAATAMFPDRYPHTDQPVELGLRNSAATDRDAPFRQTEEHQLRTLFQSSPTERVARGELLHVSVFALAPQPLLILLGTLLGDIVPTDVYQRHREPPTWNWPSAADSLRFNVVEPSSPSGTPALVLELS